MDDPFARNEIEQAMRAEKERFGVPGTVAIVGHQAELRAGNGAPVAVDVDNLMEQWTILPEDLRQRKVTEVTRRLVEAYRSSGERRPSGGSGGVVAVTFGGLAVALVAAAAGGWILFNKRPAPATVAPVATQVAETEDEARGRWARVCDATRRRLYAGASMGPFDSEGFLNGWVAEIWLAHSKGALKQDPTFGGMIDQGKLTKSADAVLAALPDGSVDLGEGLPPADAKKSPTWRAVTVRLHGRYVSAFFDQASRARLLSLADRLADVAGAQYGALYAHCAHLPVHDAGAWFRGTTPGDAATALVYTMGFFAEMPAVDRSSLSPTGELDALSRSASKLDQGALGALVGSSSGSLTSNGSSVVVTFPTGAGVRAVAASRTVARKLGVGSGAD